MVNDKNIISSFEQISGDTLPQSLELYHLIFAQNLLIIVNISGQEILNLDNF